MKDKIFITGGTGFIGEHVVDYLTKRDYEVVVLTRKKIDKKNYVLGDLTDKDSLIKAIPKKSIVINLAANPYDPKLSYEVNVKGTEKLIEACKKNEVKKIIHISSQATKIKNKGVYATTKGKSDEIVKKSGLKYVILKPSLVYGDGEKGLFNKIRSFVEKLPVVPIFGNGKTRLNPIMVTDLCKFIELSMTEKDNVVYDVGCEKSINYNELYKGIIGNKKVLFLHIPTWIGLLMGRVFEILKFKNPPFYIDNVLGSTQETNCKSSEIIKKYKFKPSNFMDNKIKIAVVGLGKMGLLHLCVLSSMADVEITALVDSNIKLFKMIKSMGISGNFYSSLNEAIKNEKIDGVFILTPTFTHMNLILEAKNKSIFVEKPLALNLDQLEKLKKINGLINVGYTLLYKRIFYRIKQIIDKKELGKILSFKASYEHSEVLMPKKGWMFEKEKSGGGVMMNPGPHLFSLINLFFGKPVDINGSIDKKYSTEVDDEAKLKLKYKGYNGEMELNWSVKNKPIAQLFLEIKFEKGTIKTDGKELNIKGKVFKDNQLEPIYTQGSIYNINPEANGEAYFVEDRLFIDSIKSGNNNINNLQFAYNTELIIHKAYKKCLKN